MTNQQDLQVIFGTGPLATAVMRELLRQGKPVRMVNTRGQADVPASVEVVKGDAYSVESVTAVTAGAQVVYQCAQPPYHQWPEKFPAMQAAILEGTARSGAKLVLAENLYMYGLVDGPITEDLPFRAHTRKGQVRARMAEQLLEAHQRGHVRAASARGSDFYGPGVLNSALGDRVFVPILQGKKASAVGNLDLLHTYTYIDDFGKALVVLGEREEALGQAWHVPNPPPLTTRALLTMAFQQVGHTPQMSGMSKLMMRIGGLFVMAARESVEMMYEFEHPFVVDHGKFARAFGDHATPHDAALAQTLSWYKTHHAA